MAGGVRRRPNSSGCSLGAVPVRPRMSCGRVLRPLTSPAGLPCSRLQQPALWQPASFPSRWETLPTLTGRHSISAMSSPRPSLLHRWPADCPCGPRPEPWIFSSRGLVLPWTFAVCHGSPWNLASRHASHWDRGLAGKGATKKKERDISTVTIPDCKRA